MKNKFGIIALITSLVLLIFHSYRYGGSFMGKYSFIENCFPGSNCISIGNSNIVESYIGWIFFALFTVGVLLSVISFIKKETKIFPILSIIILLIVGYSFIQVNGMLFTRYFKKKSVTGDSTIQTKGWKISASNKYGFSFEYPQDFKLSEANDVIANRVVLSHSVAYKHGDPCDFKGDSSQLENLTDFSVWMTLQSGNAESLAFGEQSSGVPKQKVTIGGLSGYKYTVGVEMCGMDYYYLAISPTKTLWMGNKIITELSPIISKSEVDKNLAIPGIINTTNSEQLLNEIVSTIKLVK